ncbi:MAG: hypothetical protein HY880_04070, partial [Deltaproteobacteria bacterium]|nr:hypothetical protein [Deltaproteobacteria bacterium]
QISWRAVCLTSIMGLFTRGAPKAAGLKRIFEGLRDYLAGRTGEFRG